MRCQLHVQSLLAACVLALTTTASGIDNGGFEASPFTSGWSFAGKVVRVQGLVAGSTNAAWLAGSGTTRLGQNVSWSADWYLDFRFAITNTQDRAFSLFINVGPDASNVGSATVNLRYQAGQFNAYATGSWGSDLGLGSLLTSIDNNGDGDITDPGDVPNVYRMRITGRSWGSANARYDLALSSPNATNFTATATNLTRWQNSSGGAGPPTAFVFNTMFGANPGFWLDEVSGPAGTPVVDSNLVVNISGTYPHLSVFSGEGECGIGAVASWNNQLWFVTYPPHHPGTGPDKLWTVDTNLVLRARSESVGGTHANRMVHRESAQLIMGPYFIDSNSNVRAVSRSAMPGRLTGTARHLGEPESKVLFATMEEGFYEVDVNTLAVTMRYPDTQGGGSSIIPGYHGKGLYTGQGRVVYSNNGEPGWSQSTDPGLNAQAGALVENLGENLSNSWVTVERKNFTEVTGPGSIYGPRSASDPIWATGWDKRSVILKLLEGGQWHTFRLPKGSFTQDALHGWFTEWPRIREVVEGKFLMHMHGMFYDFPGTFSLANHADLKPICTYLKMPVDYCSWNGQLVMGRDDTSTTGGNQWAGQSHSAPWFGQLSDLRKWGAPAGFGGPWRGDAVAAGTPSDPFLISGFKTRVLHLKHSLGETVGFALQTDAAGDGNWTTLTNLSVSANGYRWYLLPTELTAPWVRVVPDRSATGVTAWFHLANPPTAPEPSLFEGIADASAEAWTDGIIRPRGGDARTLQFAATIADGQGATQAYYEIDGTFQLRRATNASAESALRTTYGLNSPEFTVDAASVVVTEGGTRFRLPKSYPIYDASFASGWPRGKREVVTERNMFQAHGTFYELPKSDSGGFRRVRPITTHNKHISDFGSWRGLFVIAGVAGNARTNNHVFRSEDGKAALWFGNVDDLWRMGPPSGMGGPWKDSAVAAGVPSDGYLMFGYQRKTLALSHKSTEPVVFRLEVDVAADNTWSEYARFTVEPGQTFTHVFPEGYSAHWVRIVSDQTTTATAIFSYGSRALFGGAAMMNDGNVQLTFSGTPNQRFTMLATTNLLLPIGEWDRLTSGLFGQTPEVYADLEATNWHRRFYTLSLP